MTNSLMNQRGLDPDQILKAIFKEPEWMSKSATGGLMNASALVILTFNHDSPIFIPICFCLWAFNIGYILRAMRTRMADPSVALPKWDEWQDLFVSGMSWLAVKTFYSITLWFFTAFVVTIALILGLQKIQSAAFLILSIVTVFGVAFLHLLVDLILALTMANFAEEESMISAFAYLKVGKRFLNAPRDFLAAWILGIGIRWLGLVVPLVTMVGIIFLPSTVFVSELIAAAIMAKAWRTASKA